jgi:repressor LexA
MNTTPQAQLTPRQRDVLAWIAEHIERHGYSPTIREGQSALGFKSPHGFWIHVTALIRKGFLSSTRKCGRTIRLTAQGAIAGATAGR